MACCNFYGVNYSSVLSYRNKHKCSTEEAIEYYRLLQNKKSFYFKKMKWNSLRDCCDYFEFNYESLKSYMRIQNKTRYEALMHYYNRKKDSYFKFEKVKYSSFSECCKAYGLRSASVIAYAKRKKYLRRHALIKCIELAKKRQFIFQNVAYKSFSFCCRQHGFDSPGNIIAYAKRHQVSRQDALEHYITLKKEPFIFHDKIYCRLSECCKEYEINESSVQSYMYRTGLSYADALEYYISLYKKREFCWNGIVYKDITICCKEHEIDPRSVWNRAWRTKSSLTDAFEHCLRSKNPDCFIYHGKSYSNIPECCKEYGINPQSVHSYLFRNKSDDIPEAIDYIMNVTEKRKFVWIDGTVYKSLPLFCKEKQISYSSVRDLARKKEISVQEAASYYINKKVEKEC